MPLANDASAAARGRHVVSVGVATRSSSNSNSSSSSSTYVADQRHSPPAGHPRTRDHPPPPPPPPPATLTTSPRHLHAARRYPTHRAGCCSRGMIPRIPSTPSPAPLSRHSATRKPNRREHAAAPRPTASRVPAFSFARAARVPTTTREKKKLGARDQQRTPAAAAAAATTVTRHTLEIRRVAYATPFSNVDSSDSPPDSPLFTSRRIQHTSTPNSPRASE